MRSLYLFIIITIFAAGCHSKTETRQALLLTSEPDPELKDGGKLIEFPANSKQLQLFTTISTDNRQFQMSLSAPASVVGRVEKSGANPLIVFDAPDITGVYSAFIQNESLAKTARINFDRVNDLYKNGAATGKEFNDASSELMTVQTSLAENEARLREAGLNPESLKKAGKGTIWLICDLPESELNLVKKGQKYDLKFPSFPGETFSANIDVIADVMNTQTRKIKVRLSMVDKQERIRPGMYAEVKFEAPHKGLMIPKKAVISANARYYVFIKKTANVFERREVTLSSEAGDYIEISGGLKTGETVVTSNVYLLKGIDLGI
ncbi:MAG: efflux RND transporter periplasmic adaptor subunit [Bacteroidota bacterium]|nr:efflux RND transporter periplasmic adaptor subunit [Bacteroidota bacterium]